MKQDDVAKMNLDKEPVTKCSLICRFVNTALIWHGSGLITSLTEVQRIQSCLFHRDYKNSRLTCPPSPSSRRCRTPSCSRRDTPASRTLLGTPSRARSRTSPRSCSRSCRWKRSHSQCIQIESIYRFCNHKSNT